MHLKEEARMRRNVVGLVVVVLMGCASGGVLGGQVPDVVIKGGDGRYPDQRRYPDDGRGYPDDRDYPDRRGRGRDDDYSYRGYRTIRVPRGLYPPAGACRVWFEGRPPRYQAPPMRCDRLFGRVPYGSFILYGGRAWDGDFDWARYERRYRGSVPRLIVQISASMRQRRR
jgi:hypothetical protein